MVNPGNSFPSIIVNDAPPPVDINEILSSISNFLITVSVSPPPAIENALDSIIASAIFLVPKKSVIFQSIVNLKILKNKLINDKKTLTIVTSDITGTHLAEKADIKVVSSIEIEESKPIIDESFNVKIQPIQARRNEYTKERPAKSEKKITIGELLRDFRENNKVYKNGIDKISSFNFSNPNRKFLALVLTFSIGLFMLISYIALPGATIYINPKFDNISHTTNITLVDKHKNQNLLQENLPHIIASEEIVTTTKQTRVFHAISKKFEGVNAKGKIKIINTSDEEWLLKEETRFSSPNGLIFRIQEGVFVPPATLDEAGNKINGELIAKVVADPFDMYGDPVGKKGNIEASKFIIPGLSKFNQELIWGESSENMRGGITKYKTIVLEDDINAAKKQLEDNLILMAKEDLRNYIDELNKINHSNLRLLDDSRYLKTELLELRVSDDLHGSYKDKFEVFAKVKAEGVAYDFNNLYTLMKNELTTRAHPDMKIREDLISPDKITYDVIDKEEDLGKIKITASIKGIEEYVITGDQIVARKFAKKVKDKILSLNTKEAESIIGNMTEVNEIQIKTWPFWITKIPRVPENIKIKLMTD